MQLGLSPHYGRWCLVCIYCARAQLISQHVDAGQLNVPPQQ